MTELLRIDPGDKILEIGTGSGYQAAVLSEMGAKVFSVEINPALAESARVNLITAGYSGFRTKVGDGHFGWPKHAPYDGIIVTCAPERVPGPLYEQLKPTGRMVIPLGPEGMDQTLCVIERREGEWITRDEGAVRFVPFRRPG
jgi:protein-L-isoaspartate(D-aspartate) O-methyltransferase